MLFCTLHPRYSCSCSWSPLQALGINLPPVTIQPPRQDECSTLAPHHPTRVRGSFPGRPHHTHACSKPSTVSCQSFPSSVEPGGLCLFLSPPQHLSTELGAQPCEEAALVTIDSSHSFIRNIAEHLLRAIHCCESYTCADEIDSWPHSLLYGSEILTGDILS